MSVAELLQLPSVLKDGCVEAAIMDGKMGEANSKLEQVRANLRALNSADKPR